MFYLLVYLKRILIGKIISLVYTYYQLMSQNDILVGKILSIAYLSYLLVESKVISVGNFMFIIHRPKNMHVILLETSWYALANTSTA